MRHSNLIIPFIALAASAALVGGIPLQAFSTDARIEASVKDSYNFRTYLKDDAITVASLDGIVTLSGTVTQEDHKALAEETAGGLPDVKKVEDKLTVAADQPAVRSDAWITMKVKAVLAIHKSVSGTGTEVRTQDGVVTLSGSADNQAQKDLTAEYAKDVDGVTEVHNQMIVGSTGTTHEKLAAKVDDASITAQIKVALLFHRSTHALATKVATREGVVTVHGEALNPAERDLVTKFAEDINGVKQVKNKMTLRKS